MPDRAHRHHFAPDSAARGRRRALLLLGTGLVGLAAWPAPATAQNECGAPPPGGGTVTCPAGNYPDGITYVPVEDLTVVLEPGVDADESVSVSSFVPGADLRIEGQTNTSIGSTQSGYGVGEGVFIASNGTVYAGVDSVATTGAMQSRGISAQGKYGTDVLADTVSTVGDNSAGIFARSGNFKYGEGHVSVRSNTVTTSGDFSWGIDVAAAYGGDVSIVSGSVATAGDGAGGIVAGALAGETISIASGTVTTAGTGAPGIVADLALVSPEEIAPSAAAAGAEPAAALGPAGGITITSDAVTTTGNSSPGIDAEAATGDNEIDSGSVATGGTFSSGIVARAPAGSVSVASNAVTTAGDYSAGIVGLGGTLVTIDSGAVATLGDSADGIFAYTGTGNIAIVSGAVTTAGDQSDGIVGYSGTGNVVIDSGSVATSGYNASGIIAERTGTGGGGDLAAGGSDYAAVAALGPSGGVSVTSDAVTTSGDSSPGIDVYAATGDIEIFSGSVTTGGAGSDGISAYAETGNVLVDSGTVTTAGANSEGIYASADAGSVTVDSTSVTTAGADAIAILAGSYDGAVSVTSGTVATAGANAVGIAAGSEAGDVSVDSGTVTTTGALGVGIAAGSKYGDVEVTSDSVTTSGSAAVGIGAGAERGDVIVDSGTVATSGDMAVGIFAGRTGKYGSTMSVPGTVTVTSDSVTTAGADAPGILANNVGKYGNGGSVVVASGAVTTAGDNSNGISALAGTGKYGTAGTVTVTSGTVATAGDSSDGIFAEAPGDVSVTSATVGTAGERADGIDVLSHNGDVAVTSGSITTTGDYGTGIVAEAEEGDVTVVSTGTISTGGLYGYGIYAVGAGAVSVTSDTVVTTGDNSTGIFALQPGPVEAEAAPAAAGVAQPALGPAGGVTVTSGSVTTSGAASPGIDAIAEIGDVEVTSTGTIMTTGADSPGIRAESKYGSVLVDANAVSAAGADAIVVTSADGSNVVVRGLVAAAGGFEIQAEGGAAAVSTTASGTIRGAIDLTGNADTVSNAGTFEAIGTSQFGAGSDSFANSGTTRSTGGAAVLAGLESFASSGLIDMRDGATGDTLNVSGAFIGSGASRLNIDVDFGAETADVLITGAATGSTLIDIGQQNTPLVAFDPILVVDAAAGTVATAFTLGEAESQNPFVRFELLFDAPNNNFLLAGGPDQPVFETVMHAEMMLNVWHQSAGAVFGQLGTARDERPDQVSQLAADSGVAAWAQLYAGEHRREASQTAAGGTLFDVGYEQQFEGLQAGIDYQLGALILGLTAGLGRADSEFDASFNRLDLESTNLGAYAAFGGDGFFANALVKVDWIDAETFPGGGLSAAFDATAYGARAEGGFRFAIGSFYAEPSVSLSWVSVDVDDYTIAGAGVASDKLDSLRGAAGVRIGTDVAMATGVVSPFIGGFVTEEFDGDALTDFTFGSSTIGLAQEAPGTWGELVGGVSYVSRGVEAFVRGELEVGGDVEGLSGRAGARLRF